MNARDRLLEELAALEGVVSGGADAAPGSALELARSGLEIRLGELVGELQSIDRRELDVVIDGSPVEGRAIRIDFLSQLLDELQESVTSIGQASTGRPTSGGFIDRETRDSTALRLSNTFEGSFGVELVGPLRSTTQGRLFIDASENEEKDIFDESIATLLDVLQASADDDYQLEIFGRVSDLGSRAVGHLRQLAGVLAASEAPTRFRWHSPEKPIEVRVDRPLAERLVDVLTHTESSEADRLIEGRLGGASMFRGKFEIQLEDGTVLSGNVDPGLVNELPDLFNRDVQATLVVTTTRSTLRDLVNESFTLTRIAPR